MQLQQQGLKQVHILTPEKGEYNRSYKMYVLSLSACRQNPAFRLTGRVAGRFKPALDRSDGTITMGYLQESRKGFLSFLLTKDEDTATASLGESAKKADVFMVINVTSADLPALEQYAAEAAAQKPLILWNLELDTLRSDLGAGAAVLQWHWNTLKLEFGQLSLAAQASC